MTSRPTHFALVILAGGWFFTLSLTGSGQSGDEESLGRQAEQAGKRREALTHYVAALRQAIEGSDVDQRLREKAIAVVRKLKPAPAVPNEVIDHEGRAEAAVKSATKKEDFLDAASEYRKALRLAPWLAQDYFNLGVVLEKAGSFDEALRSFKLYLLAAPSAQDATEVRKKIAGLQYEIEKAEKERARAEEQQRAQVRTEQERRQTLSWLSGTWDFKSVEAPPQLVTTSWGTFEFMLKDHAIEGNELVTRRNFSGREIQVSSPKLHLVLRGELLGDDPATIRWTNYYADGAHGYCRNTGRWGTWVEVSLDVSYDKKSITFSVPHNICCDASDQCQEFSERYVLTR